MPKFAYDSISFDRTPMASHVRNVTCPACAKNFTQTGFCSHLRQTKNAHCVTLYVEIVGKDLEFVDQDGREPQHFEGDIFGDHDD